MVKIFEIYDCTTCYNNRYHTNDKTHKCHGLRKERTLPDKPSGFNSKRMPHWCPLPTSLEYFMERLS